MNRLLEKKVALFENYLAVTQKMLTAPALDLGGLIDQRFSIMAGVDTINTQIALENIQPSEKLVFDEKLNALIKQTQEIDIKASKRIKDEYDETGRQLKQGNVNIKYATAMKGYLPENQTGRVIDERK